MEWVLSYNINSLKNLIQNPLKSLEIFVGAFIRELLLDTSKSINYLNWLILQNCKCDFICPQYGRSFLFLLKSGIIFFLSEELRSR